MAELDLHYGRAETALDRLLPLLDRRGLEEGDVTDFLPVLALAYLELGQIDQARDVVAEALSRARAEHARPVLIETLRVQALLAVQQQAWDLAARSLEEGLELARRMPYPYAEARLLYVTGILHVEQGVPDVARERWEEALAHFTRIGALGDAAQTEEAIRRLPGASVQITVHQEDSVPTLRLGGESPRLSRTERQAWALAYLRETGAISPRAYASALDVSVDTALRDLSDLTRRGEIMALGTTKDRRYVLRQTMTRA
jgi:tetratricopeptide (TPR) repeat protein